MLHTDKQTDRQTHKQTNKQINAGKNIYLLAEVNKVVMIPGGRSAPFCPIVSGVTDYPSPLPYPNSELN